MNFCDDELASLDAEIARCEARYLALRKEVHNRLVAGEPIGERMEAVRRLYNALQGRIAQRELIAKRLKGPRPENNLE